MPMKTNTFHPDPTLEELKNLINYSVNNLDVEPSKFRNLHQDIIEKYFVAQNVRINYTEQTIDLELFMSNDKFTNLTFECLDLIGFLQSCLKADDVSLNYYQTLMIQYDVVVAA